METVWSSIDRRFSGRLTRRIVLGGMLESWGAYHDPVNDVGRPAQMAPLWFAASQRTGVPMSATVWHVDPPGSSWPASVAVKAAAIQGDSCGAAYLRLAREAVMVRGLNIARPAILRQLGLELAVADPGGFDADRFQRDLVSDAASEAFAADLREARQLGVGRFPTLIVRGPLGGRMAVGYRDVSQVTAMLAATGVLPDGELREAEAGNSTLDVRS